MDNLKNAIGPEDKIPILAPENTKVTWVREIRGVTAMGDAKIKVKLIPSFGIFQGERNGGSGSSSVSQSSAVKFGRVP